MHWYMYMYVLFCFLQPPSPSVLVCGKSQQYHWKRIRFHFVSHDELQCEISATGLQFHWKVLPQWNLQQQC